MTDAALTATGVSVDFGDDGVVDDADLRVESDEVLLLLGPNGVGKTVLLSCLAGSRRPTTGEIRIDGRPVEDDGGEGLSFLRQDAMAVDRLTGRENAAFYGRLHPSFTDRWRDYVDRFELTGDLDRRVADYSAGMKRKLELALATSVDVPLYLLDEPTAGVDLSMVQRFHDVLLERNADGAALVVTSHRPADAEIADRIAFVVDGTVAESGAPADLFDRVPDVVRVSGTRALDAAADHVLGGDLFGAGAEARGFLRDGSDADDVRAALDHEASPGVSVSRAEPTYTDLFNYYVHVDGDRQ